MNQFGGSQIAAQLALATAARAQFGGRLYAASATELGIEFVGPYSEVNGYVYPTEQAVIETDPIVVDGTGALSTSTLDPDTFYYVYLTESTHAEAPLALVLSQTEPTAVSNVMYLGASGEAAKCRSVGWVYTNGSGEFDDDLTKRNVCSRYNRIPKLIELRPGRNDNDAKNTISLNSATYTAINAGTNDSATFISADDHDGQSAFAFDAAATINAAITARVAICVQLDAIVNGSHDVTDFATCIGNGALADTSIVLSGSNNGGALADVFRVTLLGMTSGNAVAFVADYPRNGLSTDPAATYLRGYVFA